MLLLCLSGSRGAHAETSEGDRAAARALALEGYDALQRKDFATAEDRFRRADKLVHAPTLLVDHARALVGMGRFVEAYERYGLVLREGVADNSPWPWKRALKDAENEIEALKPRVAWLTIGVVGPRRPTVFIDGRRVPAAAVGVPRAVNPGRRVVAARARGYGSKEREVTLKEGQQLEIELLLERLPQGTPEEPDERVEPDAPPEDLSLAPAPPPRGGARRTLGYVALSAGALGLVVGSVTGVMALGAKSDLAGRCAGGTCSPESDAERTRAEQDISRYGLFRTASTVGFGFGALSAAVGGYLLLWPSSEASPVHASFRVRPLLGVGSVGLAGSF